MLAVDWLALCRRTAGAVRVALERYPLYADRALTTGLGVGGDTALVIDRVAEEAVFGQLEALDLGMVAVSEERGEVEIGGGGPLHVVIDPLDGSRNAKRGVPIYALSIAVAGGETMRDVDFAYVHDFGQGEDWWAHRGRGAFLEGEPLPALDGGTGLEMLGLETIHPGLVRRSAEALAATGAARMRALGSIALSLCYVAAGRFDGMLTLDASRSVDTAAGQLIVREAGGRVAFPEAAGDPLEASLRLDMRSRVVAAATPEVLELLLSV